MSERRHTFFRHPETPERRSTLARIVGGFANAVRAMVGRPREADILAGRSPPGAGTEPPIDDDGLAGSGVPRKPITPAGSGAAEAEPPLDDRL
jgi:hypothetical protein